MKTNSLGKLVILWSIFTSILATDRWALTEASREGRVAEAEFILNNKRSLNFSVCEKLFCYEQLRSGQTAVNMALCGASRNDQVAVVEMLLNRPYGKLRPDQDGIDLAFGKAVKSGTEAMVDLMLNRPQSTIFERLACRRKLRPSKSSIIDAYRNAITYGNIVIIRLLAPYVPLSERLNQRVGAGLAFEIHNFADTKVITQESPLSSSSAANSKPVKLIDAVSQHMLASLAGVDLIPYTDAEKIVKEAVEKFIPVEKQDLAKEAVLYRLASDNDYEQQLSVVVTFVQTQHKDKMEQWIFGFVNESITAYVNSINSTSCSKGIRERASTGLRGIDPILDRLFAQAEGPLLMRNWLKKWNLKEINDETKQDLVRLLKERGINGKSDVGEVANAFREIAKDELILHDVQDNEVLHAEIEIYADSMFEEYYCTSHIQVRSATRCKFSLKASRGVNHPKDFLGVVL